MTRRRLLQAGGALALPVCLAGAARPAKTVMIDQLAFSASPADLRVGDTVVWRNRDVFRHTATADDASFDLELPPGRDVSLRLTKPGRIGYYCRYHLGMKAVLDVKPKG